MVSSKLAQANYMINRTNTEPLFKDNILKIEDHHKLNVSTLMYQMKSRQIPEGFLYLNYLQAPVRSTRQSHLANQHLARTNFTASLVTETMEYNTTCL